MSDDKGNAIKEARIRAGLSIKQLADLLGAPYRTVQDWNSGLHRPPAWIERLVLKEIKQNKLDN